MRPYEIKLWQSQARMRKGLPPVVKIVDAETGDCVATMGESPVKVGDHYEPGRLAQETLALMNGEILPLDSSDVMALRSALDLVKEMNQSVARSLIRVAKLLRAAVGIANDEPGKHEGIERIADDLTDIIVDLQGVMQVGDEL